MNQPTNKNNNTQKGEGYEFFPGSGEKNDVVGNIINTPLSPLWRHGKDPANQPRQQNRHQHFPQHEQQQQRQAHGTRSRTLSMSARQEDPEDHYYRHQQHGEESEQLRRPRGSGRSGYRDVCVLCQVWVSVYVCV